MFQFSAMVACVLGTNRLGGGGWLHFIHFWLLKGYGNFRLSMKLATFQSKFYAATRSIKTVFTPEHKLQPILLGPGGLYPPWRHCYMLFELFWTKWLSYNINQMRWRKTGVRRERATYPLSILTLKKELEH